MENYILIKELPDAHIGTKVTYYPIGDGIGYYRYWKSNTNSDNRIRMYNDLTINQVIKNPDFFIPESKYWDTYIWNNPTYSGHNIYGTINKVVDIFKENKLYTTILDIFVEHLNKELRELGKTIYESNFLKDS